MPNPRELDPSESMQALFGAELRRFRTAAGLSQEALGEVLGYTGSLVGQVETGRRLPSKEFAQRLDGALDTGGIFGRWWPHITRSSFPHYFRMYAELERRACAVSEYSGNFIPGLAQTEGYMRAVFRSAMPVADEQEVEAQVRNRLGRQHLLGSPTRPLLWWLTDEAALIRPAGGHGVMSDQLRFLGELIRSHLAVVQILPIKQGPHALLEGVMSLMSFADGSPDMAYIEGPHAAILVEDVTTVRKCQLSFDLARADALTPAASLALIDTAAREHTQQARAEES
ncbi:Scr1 family TA system antitoxin-like transcriptional regulator [Kitasatospora sp. NPDC088346]|uniref:helix-turn-helix domain-containing protein n=1 Tax=Kitasatospora sp. NPDC088346 TaxID=3364073 RepID=UPI0038271608